jgi:uncharacterized protein (TIGR03437 family)
LLIVGCWVPLRAQTVGNCPTFPSDNIWNIAVDGLPLDANSSAYVATIGASSHVHADFGSGLWDGGPIGIPYIVVNNAPRVPVVFGYADESDPGPYPIPANAPIEGGAGSTGDRHVLVVDQASCTLYELYAAYPQANGSWQAGSGAIFDLRANWLRPAGWTSADAAGLPILAGLVRYDEVLAGEIRHAIRFTVPQTRKAYVWPARHYASSRTGAQYPPMGQRFRLRADFDISGFSATNQVILRALKKYGMILADNGSAWFISGAPDERWNNDDLHQLDRVKGSDFEAVDVSSLMVDPNSAQARTAGAIPPNVTAVVNAASFAAGASPGAWIAVYGTNLATTTRSWRDDEIIGGRLPVELDGVGVTIAGVPAAISYISPGQLNVQVPDVALGAAVPLQVGSAVMTLAIQQTAPALFLYDADGRRYAAAQHVGYSIVGRTGLYAGSTPARPGEIVILYGTGFGATAPTVPAGYLVTQAARLARPVTVRIGGVDAAVDWAGLSGAGLYQFNVRVPAGLPDGDATVVVEIDGVRTQDGVYLTIGGPK